MNVVSFETAKRLKEAGFPQPEDLKCRPQAWYTPDIFGGTGEYFLGYDADGLINRENSYYAPTATELLPDKCDLVKEAGDWAVGKDGKRIGGWDRNPAEAAAAAWLYVNAK